MATMILHWKIVYFKNANPNKYILIFWILHWIQFKFLFLIQNLDFGKNVAVIGIDNSAFPKTK